MPVLGELSMAQSLIILSKLHLTGQPPNVESMLNILHILQLVILDLCLETEDGRDLMDFRPFMKRFLKSNRQYLKDRLWLLSIESDFAQWHMADNFTSFKIFTQLNTLEV